MTASTATRRCAKCGAELGPTALFCTECGTAVPRGRRQAVKPVVRGQEWWTQRGSLFDDVDGSDSIDALTRAAGESFPDDEPHPEDVGDDERDVEGPVDQDLDDEGPDDEGPDGEGPDGEGPDGEGPDGEGPDVAASVDLQPVTVEPVIVEPVTAEPLAVESDPIEPVDAAPSAPAPDVAVSPSAALEPLAKQSAPPDSVERPRADRSGSRRRAPEPISLAGRGPSGGAATSAPPAAAPAPTTPSPSSPEPSTPPAAPARPVPRRGPTPGMRAARVPGATGSTATLDEARGSLDTLLPAPPEEDVEPLAPELDHDPAPAPAPAPDVFGPRTIEPERVVPRRSRRVALLVTIALLAVAVAGAGYAVLRRANGDPRDAAVEAWTAGNRAWSKGDIAAVCDQYDLIGEGGMWSDRATCLENEQRGFDQATGSEKTTVGSLSVVPEKVQTVGADVAVIWFRDATVSGAPQSFFGADDLVVMRLVDDTWRQAGARYRGRVVGYLPPSIPATDITADATNGVSSSGASPETSKAAATTPATLSSSTTAVG